MTTRSCRRTDPMTGVVAEVGTDGVPVGLALPEELLDRAPADVARAVLRALTAAAGDARDLLDRLAEQEWDEAGWEDAALRDDAEVDDDHGDDDYDYDVNENDDEWRGGAA
ncbi:hypothetical protein [Rhodococcus sp. IEGM 1408]|uniref:hypothetical protein n=1 Tax=Rhodococcus sp. IEGM 1408 TaxID=3082220 RepID=UPI0029559A2E|nr:hypothetical protein [Rhodococcus sp. IEGM 1408]MDV8000915.1 hypothetical protein [Rhodococcus sp. IEGM 1408]